MSVQNAPNVKYCPKCGGMLAAYLPTCGHCGAPQPGGNGLLSDPLTKLAVTTCVLLCLACALYTINTFRGWMAEAQTKQSSQSPEERLRQLQGGFGQ